MAAQSGSLYYCETVPGWWLDVNAVYWVCKSDNAEDVLLTDTASVDLLRLFLNMQNTYLSLMPKLRDRITYTDKVLYNKQEVFKQIVYRSIVFGAIIPILGIWCVSVALSVHKKNSAYKNGYLFIEPGTLKLLGSYSNELDFVKTAYVARILLQLKGRISGI